jgi:hypothetical protein
MYDTTQKFAPPDHTVFGDLYVREQHNEAADRNLPPSDIGKIIVSLKTSMLYELMKSLRSALYIRRKG